MTTPKITTPKVDVTLLCGHVVYFSSFSIAPAKGHKMWCARCEDMRVIEFAPNEFRVTCKNCVKMNRPAGRSLPRARSLADAHLARHPSHSMVIFDGLVPVLEVDSVVAQGDPLF